VASVAVNGIRLSYHDHGGGPPVLMVMGTGARGRVWDLHQTPALRDAGYRVITFDNRGIPPSSVGHDDFTLDDMATDIAELIVALELAPCRVVGFSLGAFVLQELLIQRPELVDRAVLMATRARTDMFRAVQSEADRMIADLGVPVPARVRAVLRMSQSLSPGTLADEAAARDWLDIFETGGAETTACRRQLELDTLADRRPALRQVRVPTLVLGFTEDQLCPPHLAREVADAIPGADYREIADCGHLGYLERPDEVNRVLIEFLGRPLPGPQRTVDSVAFNRE
jgi:pimeloyl-ACP methyl ester carboxylesterase